MEKIRYVKIKYMDDIIEDLMKNAASEKQLHVLTCANFGAKSQEKNLLNIPDPIR